MAYGPRGFTKEDIPKTLFGQFEFEQGDMFRDISLLTGFIKTTAQQKNLGSVGGSVVVSVVMEAQGIFLPTGKVYRLEVKTGREEIISKTEIINGKLFAQTESGIMVELTTFHQYHTGKGNFLL